MGLKGVLKFFTVRIFEVIIGVLLLTFMPNVPPHAKFSEPYSVTPSLPLEGKLAINERLNDAEIWHKGDFLGPEAFAEYNGELYTTLHGGDVVKLTGNHIIPVVKFGKPCKGFYQEQICGRPLGLTFDKSGALYVADAYYGLFKVDVKTGKKLQLVSMDHEINGKKPKLPNSVALASNGDLFWTDSSTEFLLQDGLFDMLADGSGRLIHYDAKTKKNAILIDGLHFANGVALSSDESFLIVSETGRSRIHRYYLKGPKQGTSDIFIDGLPGLPDNLHHDGQDGFLVPLVIARDEWHPLATQIFGPFPLARKFLARIFGLVELGFKIVDQVYPNKWAEQGIHFVGHFTMTSALMPKRVTLLHVSEKGEIVDSAHAMDKKISGISEAFVYKNHLYLGSPFNDYIARVPLDNAGFKHLAKRSSGDKVPTIEAAPRQQATTKQTEGSKQAPPVTTPAPRQSPSTTNVPKQAPATQAPKQVPDTQPPKQVPTTQPLKQASSTEPLKQSPTTQPPKQAPKQAPTTQPPKQAPTTQLPKQVPTTQPPKQVPTTQPPKQAPSQPPKQVPTTQAPKQAPSSPKQAPSTPKTNPKEAPTTTSVPKQETVKPTQVPKEAPPTPAPVKQGIPTPQAQKQVPKAKEPTAKAPNSPPPLAEGSKSTKKETKESSKPISEPKAQSKDKTVKNEL